MLKNTLHTKWITRFLVLIYLLLSFSIANASFWCQGAENSSHLEFNPGGQYWTSCNIVDDDPHRSEETTTSEFFWSALGEDCFDSPVYSSIITSSNRTSPLSKNAAANIVSLNLPFIPIQSSEAARFTNATLASQLPTPLVLTALRTVVLLH